MDPLVEWILHYYTPFLTKSRSLFLGGAGDTMSTDGVDMNFEKHLLVKTAFKRKDSSDFDRMIS